MLQSSSLFFVVLEIWHPKQTNTLCCPESVLSSGLTPDSTRNALVIPYFEAAGKDDKIAAQTRKREKNSLCLGNT